MLKYLIHAATEITVSAEGNRFVMSAGASVLTRLFDSHPVCEMQRDPTCILDIQIRTYGMCW